MKWLMRQFFISHVEPLHLLKGQEALFFIREQDPEQKLAKFHTVVKEIPHYFFTPNYSHEEAKRQLTEFEKNKDLQGMTFAALPYNKNKSFLRAKGSKEDRLRLTLPFLCKKNSHDFRDPLGLNSPSRLLRWLYPPTMLLPEPTAEAIPSPEEMIAGKYRRSYVSLEALVQDHAAVLDIEVEDWETGKDHIYMAVYLSLHAAKPRAILFHDLPFADAAFEGAQLRQYHTQEELGKLLTVTLHDDDPLWIFGHNIMNYDQIKLRSCTDAYFPAVNTYHPVTKSSQGFGRVITKGRWTLETYGFHFNYENILANNSLGTLSREKKSLSYEQQGIMVKEARRGNKEAFFTLLGYCLADGHASASLGNRYKEAVSLLTSHFRVEPDVIGTSGKLTVAKEYWKRRHFVIKGTFEDAWKTRREDDEPFSVEKYKREYLLKGCTKGFLKDVHVLYVTPFVAGSMSVLQRTSKDLLEKILKSGHPLEKFNMLQVLNAKISVIIEENLRILGEDCFEKPPLQLTQKQEGGLYCFYTYHGLRRLDPLAYVSSVHGALQELNYELGKYKIVNRGNYFYFLQGKIDVKKIEEQMLGCYLGKGDVFSLREGKVIANPFQEEDVRRFIYQGFGFEKGPKTFFEKRLLRDVIERVFSGEKLGKIGDYLDGEIKEMAAGKKPAKDYFVRMKTRTYYKNLLHDVLEMRTVQGSSVITDKVLHQYEKILHKIGERFSDETKREFRGIVDDCKGDFSFSFIQDAVEFVLHPYPPHQMLVHPADYDGELLPVSLAGALDYQRYKERALVQFADFYDLMRPRQQVLPF